MKVHMHTQFCLICLLTFVFHQCHHCHEDGHHSAEKGCSHNHNDYQITQMPHLQNSRTEPEASKKAEAVQKYYIEKLFERYGENGKLSFFGLEKLLTSLGLEEVKVVEINHEDIGHDHVSHLDAIEMQEGKHSHPHNHPHSHSHSGSENQTVNEGSTKRSQKCDQEKEITETSLKSDGKHAHEHNNHGHHQPHHHRHPHRHLDQNGTHHSQNDSVSASDHGEPSHEPSTETNTTQEQPERKPHKHNKKRRKDKKKSSEGSIETAQGFPPNHESNEQYEQNHVRKHGHMHITSPLHVQFHEHDNDHSTTHGHQDPNPASGDGHRHASKREMPHTQMRKRAIRSAHSHKRHNEDEHRHEECLNVTQLLRHYGLHTNSQISHSLFTCLCPALLYQIDKRLCIEHYEDLLIEDLNKGKNASLGNMEKTGASAWICGIISITVISLLSLLGVILIPIINQGCFKFLLTFLVALAVGTMSGDALLHLLPHSQGAHNHSHHNGHGHQHEHQHLHGHSHEHGEMVQSFLDEYDAVLKGLVALGGIYLLFIIEHCIRMFKHYNKQRTKQKWCKKKQKVDESPVGRKLSDHKLNRPDADWLQLKPLAGADDSVLSDDRLNETELTDLDGQLDSLPKTFLSIEEENSMLHSHNDVSRVVQDSDLPDVEHESNHREDTTAVRKHNHLWSHKHSHHSHGHCHSGKDLKDTGIANIAWMVIMGDGIHNFSDGLAIGAAFSAGLTGGISTSIAVFCHELPHELGDFAVLLKAGMTVKQAIVYNLLSAMMAYVGMLIGTAVGQYANNITLWIFAVTAGMFLYVALVDMLPEMLHGDGDNEEHGYCPVGQFILQNLGLLMGFAIMLVIALYEDKIVLDIKF
ncbi:zinc transporter ZIP10 [Rhineura floridana]|uniref:zinc transporter ZIP10 n=1 Tax=Rhineura floridana TaxID=261503 RepID=UPI002AC80E57|nr:zinc transporter ZIP10 [Rhineura floridana]XP_061464165.1 zinc transporter ZIP10 [Rhineura floridana]XP_061464166.1 zinc transporter ZIP10 [Rhineura floridana]